MIEYLKRLGRTGAAYTASSVLAKLIALFTLPIYTNHVTKVGFGQVEVLASTVIVLSILFRLGAIEAVLRFYFLKDEYDSKEVVRTGFWGLLITTTIGTAICFAFVPQLADWLLRGVPGSEDLVRIAIGWFWFATFYELLLALYRVDERAGAYAGATILNVLITVPLTIWLVVVEDKGAKGLLAGNAIGTAVIVIGLMVVHGRSGKLGKPGLPLAEPMLRFGLPTVPGEMSLYALNWVDRLMLVKIPSSPAVGLAYAGLYSVAVKFAQGVTIFVRAFQLAWPPLAYSIETDAEARVVYGKVLTYYLLVTASVVTALALVARWLVQIAAASYYDAYRAVPFVAAGVSLYGAYLVMTTAVTRMGKTGSLFPVAAAGLIANIGLCLLLIPSMNITGAGLALVGAYAVLLTLMYLRARATLGLVLEFRRLIQIISVAVIVSYTGEHLLPKHGFEGLVLRSLWWLLYPALLVLTGFFSRAELAQIRNVRALLKSARDSKSLGDRPDLVQEVHGPE